MGGQEVAELQHSQKFMKKLDAADMRQTLMITGDFYIFLENSAFHDGRQHIGSRDFRDCLPLCGGRVRAIRGCRTVTIEADLSCRLS
jgi:hypothetical protein